MNCWLAQFSDRPCDGRLVRAHLLPKRIIRLHVKDPELFERALWSPHVWVPACGGIMGNAGHHGMLDSSRTLRIPREALPPGLEEFAADLGLTWWLEREYGPREMAA